MSRLEKIVFVLVVALAVAIAWPKISPGIQPIRQLLEHEAAPRDPQPIVEALAFSPDGRFLVTRTVDAIEVDDVPAGRRVTTLPSRLAERPRLWGTAVVSPDGALVGCEETLYSLPDLKPRITLPGYAAAFSPSGDLIAVYDDSIALASVKTGEKVRALPGTRLWRAAFSPDGRLVAACVNGGIGVFSVATAERVATIDLPDFDGTFEFGSGPELYTISHAGDVDLFDPTTARHVGRLRDGETSVGYMEAFMRRPLEVAFEHERLEFAWAPDDRIEVRSLRHGLMSQRGPVVAPLRAIAFAPSGAIAFADRDSQVHILQAIR